MRGHLHLTSVRIRRHCRYNPTNPLQNDYLQTALRAANLARKITRHHFRTRIAIENKADLSPVTLADRETEEAIRHHIQSRHPDHGFFGEESGNRIVDQHWQWIVDPIDGTRSYAAGRATFGTLIALMEAGKPMLGVIDQGILDERWVGLLHTPTTFNGTPCHTRNEAALDQCSLFCTAPEMFDEESYIRFRRLADCCQFNVWGGDGYSYGLLAAGFTDIVCEADLFPYDYLPLVPVVEGAGGVITNWEGEALTLDSGDKVLATANRNLHQAALAILNQ